jgi:hypothetical protein
MSIRLRRREFIAALGSAAVASAVLLRDMGEVVAKVATQALESVLSGLEKASGGELEVVFKAYLPKLLAAFSTAFSAVDAFLKHILDFLEKVRGF